MAEAWRCASCVLGSEVLMPPAWQLLRHVAAAAVPHCRQTALRPLRRSYLLTTNPRFQILRLPLREQRREFHQFRAAYPNRRHLKQPPVFLGSP